MPTPPDATASPEAEREAERLRRNLTEALAEDGLLDDQAWRRAVETVPRHRFVPGFYAENGSSADGLTVWEPVTALTDPDRWLREVYRDRTLITQFDGDEPDWHRPAPRIGGAPTSSSTLPSLVLRMWMDADLRDGHNVLEIGTGTGYSTALACERLGDNGDVTSVEVDIGRLDLAVADGLYGYWPSAPFDRIVAACSVRAVPAPWLAQTKPGGKLLATLSGWLYGYARVLLTVTDAYTAEGPLLDGTVSFMAARTHERPEPGNPGHWASLTGDAPPRPVRHSPHRLDEATEKGFFGRFLAQLAAPDAQLVTQGTGDGGVLSLVDVTTGAAATLTPDRVHGHTVRQAGPARLWDAVEAAWDTWDLAGRPGPQEFRMRVHNGWQSITQGEANDLAFFLP